MYGGEHAWALEMNVVNIFISERFTFALRGRTLWVAQKENDDDDDDYRGGGVYINFLLRRVVFIQFIPRYCSGVGSE